MAQTYDAHEARPHAQSRNHNSTRHRDTEGVGVYLPEIMRIIFGVFLGPCCCHSFICCSSTFGALSFNFVSFHSIPLRSVSNSFNKNHKSNIWIIKKNDCIIIGCPFHCTQSPNKKKEITDVYECIPYRWRKEKVRRSRMRKIILRWRGCHRMDDLQRLYGYLSADLCSTLCVCQYFDFLLCSGCVYRGKPPRLIEND